LITLEIIRPVSWVPLVAHRGRRVGQIDRLSRCGNCRQQADGNQVECFFHGLNQVGFGFDFLVGSQPRLMQAKEYIGRGVGDLHGDQGDGITDRHPVARGQIRGHLEREIGTGLGIHQGREIADRSDVQCGGCRRNGVVWLQRQQRAGVGGVIGIAAKQDNGIRLPIEGRTHGDRAGTSELLRQGDAGEGKTGIGRGNGAAGRAIPSVDVRNYLSISGWRGAEN